MNSPASARTARFRANLGQALVDRFGRDFAARHIDQIETSALAEKTDGEMPFVRIPDRSGFTAAWSIGGCVFGTAIVVAAD